MLKVTVNSNNFPPQKGINSSLLRSHTVVSDRIGRSELFILEFYTNYPKYI